MITIKEESTVSSIYQYLKKNENNKNEFDRYCNSLMDRIIKQKNISFFHLINYMLMNNFKCTEHYLNDLFVKKNKKIKYKNKDYNLFLLPILVKSRSDEEQVRVSKSFFSTNEDLIIFNNPFVLNNDFLNQSLNIENLLVNIHTDDTHVTFQDNFKSNNYLIPILSKNEYSLNPFSILDDYAFISSDKAKSPDLLHLNDIYFDFFLKEDLKYSIFSIIEPMESKNLRIEVKIDPDSHKIDLYFYDESLHKIYPINIIEANYDSYDEMVYILEFIDETLKEKNINFKILQ